MKTPLATRKCSTRFKTARIVSKSELETFPVTKASRNTISARYRLLERLCKSSRTARVWSKSATTGRLTRWSGSSSRRRRDRRRRGGVACPWASAATTAPICSSSASTRVLSFFLFLFFFLVWRFSSSFFSFFYRVRFSSLFLLGFLRKLAIFRGTGGGGGGGEDPITDDFLIQQRSHHWVKSSSDLNHWRPWLDIELSRVMAGGGEGRASRRRRRPGQRSAVFSSSRGPAATSTAAVERLLPVTCYYIDRRGDDDASPWQRRRPCLNWNAGLGRFVRVVRGFAWTDTHTKYAAGVIFLVSFFLSFFFYFVASLGFSWGLVDLFSWLVSVPTIYLSIKSFPDNKDGH